MSPKVPRRILLKAKRFLAKINIRSATTAIDGGPLPDLKRKLRDGLNDPEARFLLIDLVTSCERAEIKARPDARFASGCADVADDLSAVLEKDTSVLRRPPKYRALLVAASLLIWLLVPVGMTAPRSVNSLPDRIYAMSPEQVASYFSVRFGPRTALAADDDSAVDDDTATDDDTTPDDDTATDGDTTADDDTTFDDDSADDDSVNEFDATLDIISPGFLEPDSEYDFDISVANTTVAGDVRRWINDVELYLPTVDYQVDETSLAAPDALHPGDGEWSADFTDNEMFIGLRWLFTNPLSSEAYGDIHEGESLDFSFRATTDAYATDGFGWYIEADNGEFVEGNEFIGSSSSDDDDYYDDDSYQCHYCPPGAEEPVDDDDDGCRGCG